MLGEPAMDTRLQDAVFAVASTVFEGSPYKCSAADALKRQLCGEDKASEVVLNCRSIYACSYDSSLPSLSLSINQLLAMLHCKRPSLR